MPRPRFAQTGRQTIKKRSMGIRTIGGKSERKQQMRRAERQYHVRQRKSGIINPNSAIDGMVRSSVAAPNTGVAGICGVQSKRLTVRR